MSQANTTPNPAAEDSLVHAMKWPLGVLCVAFFAMYLPAYYALSQVAWESDANGHGPMILGVSMWLLWREREDILAAASKPRPVIAFVLLIIGVLLYVLGGSQTLDTLQAASQIPVLMACILLVGGVGSLKRAWFPLFFLIFMVPLPGVLTQILTLPLKSAVSYVAEGALHMLGYPVGRVGVTLFVGPYQLLVADACSGLNSIFTLEALGLFYMKLMEYKSKARNTLMAMMIIPISFVSNVVRVLTLVLVTYYYGDEAGQGFMHGFAGILLFAVALVLTYGFDRFLAIWFDGARKSAA